MDAEDAWSVELKRLLATSEPDPLALDGDTAERLLDGDLPRTRRHLGMGRWPRCWRRRSPRQARPSWPARRRRWPNCGP
jgi:hypothetical protein